jgi:hypothetical protein
MNAMDTFEGHFVLKTHPKWEKVPVTVGNDGLSVEGKPTIDYAAIHEVNLSYVMASEYDVGHYLCRIWTRDGRRLFLRADATDVGDGTAYQAFVAAFHRALVEAGKEVQFTTGMRSRVGYGILLAGMGLLFTAVVAGIVWAMVEKGNVGMGVLLIAVTLAGAVFVFKMIRSMARPGVYDPRAIPGRLLPFA